MQKFLESLGFRKFTTRQVCTLSIFIALAVVFDLLSTLPVSQTLQISFSYVPVFVIAALYGPVSGGITYVISDAISAFLLYGSVSPLLSVTAFLSGLVFGLCFYKHYTFSKGFIVRLAICVLLQLVISLVINTYFLTIMYNFIFKVEIVKRLPFSLLKLAVQSVVIYFSPYYLKIFSKFTK
ncbi:MAG: folate family ECF transporter S component [Clostridia bacterium]|nr:folate family ECF transporter S component [Clostridia bacterium]